MGRLGAAWRSYRTQVIPRDVPDSQVRECRRAFYVGASALLGLILGAPDDPALREALDAELWQFSREIRAGKA